MEKIRVNIINNTMDNKMYVSIDDGIYETIQVNRIIKTLLRIIINPDRYIVEIAKH